VRIDRVTVGALDTNCWVVSDDHGGPAIVIDPGDDAPAIIATLGDRELAAVVLTHGHFDHVGAVGQLLATRAAPIAIHEADASSITTAVGTGGALFGFDEHVSPPADQLLIDGSRLQAGEVTLEVLHTPGHTPGGICLLASDRADVIHLFSGDTLFAGSVGRTDFPGGDGRQLAASLAQKIVGLPAETVVHPGHGPETTIGRESRVNPFWPRA